jgi:hypothetical protein
MVAGVGLLPRTRACAGSTQGDALSHKVAAPLANRHRSFAGDEAERGSLQVYGATAMQGARERIMMLGRFSSSPGA